MTIRNNALWNCQNPHQGKNKRVLSICSAGLLRSPTIAWYLTRNSSANCRSAGIHDYALIPVDEVLLAWADIIICSDKEKLEYLQQKFPTYLENKQVHNFDIPDIYEFCNPDLVKIIEEKVIQQGVLC